MTRYEKLAFPTKTYFFKISWFLFVFSWIPGYLTNPVKTVEFSEALENYHRQLHLNQSQTNSNSNQNRKGVSQWGWILFSFFSFLFIVLSTWRIYVSCKRISKNLTRSSKGLYRGGANSTELLPVPPNSPNSEEALKNVTTYDVILGP
ncbi:hypothetical protein ACHWQZ_G008209 [Mnemiopsis leidyi]